MKKNILAVLLAACCVILLVCIKSCVKITESAPSSATSGSGDIEKVKRWFYESWQSAPAARTSPWLHDTSFVINNYSNINPEWHLAKTYTKDGIAYTEVPVVLPDTLQFKIGPTDSTELVNLFSDSIYRNLPQSKVFWIAKQMPGQDPYAEIVTFISEYDYARSDYQRFINGVSYFDMAGYTGMVMYHDRDGKLLRVFQYVRGDIINTIRCGFEGGLDPAPGNRVHLEVCYEVLTWERDCVTSYNQDGIGQKECSEWILVGSYMIGNCFSANGGGNGTAYYSPWSEDGMDCNSFDFQKTTDAEWQEAGLTDIEFKLYKLEAHRRRTTPITVKISSPIVFGLPLRGPNGEYYSAGRAGNIAADACDKAYYSLQLWLDNNPTIPAMEELEQRYRTLVRDCMRMRGGTASPTGSGSPNIIYNKAKYRWFGNGKCW